MNWGSTLATGATIRGWSSWVTARGKASAGRRSRSRIRLRWSTGAPIRTVVVGHGVSGAVVRGLNLGLDARAMFVLEKPQDAFFRLLAGREERIEAVFE